tara:strand:+ start:108 stop:599 length:492 start_codon:yes stop_codon:yes gene_type:complete
MPLITRAEAARQMGVTVQAVYGAIKEGRLTPITNEKGKILINSDTLMNEWTRNSQFMRVKTTSYKPKAERNKDTMSYPEYNESKARTEHLKAEMMEIERKKLEDELVSAEEVKEQWVNIVTVARTKLLGIATKAKQRLPDLDTNAIACIDDIVREALEELSAA